MATSATDLRNKAADCLDRARTASSPRSQQLRQCARTFLEEARRLELFEHGNQIGRANVTLASFRAYLRAQRT